MRVLKFLLTGVLTALLDNGIFFVLNRATGIRFLSLAAATTVSVTFNYLVSRAFIFESSSNHTAVLPKYLGVHGVGLLIRWGILEALVAAFHLPPKSLGVNACKLAADGVVYSCKYFIQRDFVFKSTRTAKQESDQSGWHDAPEPIPPATRPESR